MNKSILSLIATVTMALAIFSGCETFNGAGDVYSRNQVKKANKIVPATIVRIDKVKIEGTSGMAGGIGGGILGGAIGSAFGGGAGKTIATAAGAVGGAVVGNKVEQKVTMRDALEITVQYSNGEQELIVQEAGKDIFEINQAVRVVYDAYGTKRVRP